ncbi:unnamed protein product, partial [Closterium sp. Naga37s-1]
LCNEVNCGSDGECMKDVNGKPSCSCSWGKPSSDGLSCIDTCAAVRCEIFAICKPNKNGDPSCICEFGYKDGRCS